MILIRLLIIAAIFFCCFYGLMHLCFTKGWLTWQRVRKLNRIMGLTLIALILTVFAFSFLAGVDQHL